MYEKVSMLALLKEYLKGAKLLWGCVFGGGPSWLDVTDISV